MKVLNAAKKQADSMGDEYTSTEHLLIALTQVEDQAKRLLQLNGIEESDLLEAVKTIRGGQTVQDQNPEDKFQALEKYGKDLVELAREGQNRSGHRTRHGDSSSHPGSLSSPQEQPGADW
jgi:ATP-dependent Clp protease ATP-binding subunit ClpB